MKIWYNNVLLGYLNSYQLLGVVRAFPNYLTWKLVNLNPSFELKILPYSYKTQAWVGHIQIKKQVHTTFFTVADIDKYVSKLFDCSMT
jgi:hypothetical protein